MKVAASEKAAENREKVKTVKMFKMKWPDRIVAAVDARISYSAGKRAFSTRPDGGEHAAHQEHPAPRAE